MGQALDQAAGGKGKAWRRLGKWEGPPQGDGVETQWKQEKDYCALEKTAPVAQWWECGCSEVGKRKCAQEALSSI